MPPIHKPFFLDAAILSRMRSPVTSRSNWAKDKRTFNVSRPMLVVVLNCWVIDTNETPRRRVSYRLTPWVPNNQNAEVSHNTIRMANSTPPAMGSAQPG